MGFYLGFRAGRMPPGEIEGTITPGEYCRVMVDVLRRLQDRPELARTRYQPILAHLRVGWFAAAVESLTDLLRRQPRDQYAHRLLGIAYLSLGNLRVATLHLEVARRLLKRERAASETLRDCLRVQYEEALVRYLLMPLYIRLGRLKDARALVEEGQTL